MWKHGTELFELGSLLQQASVLQLVPLGSSGRVRKQTQSTLSTHNRGVLRPVSPPAAGLPEPGLVVAVFGWSEKRASTGGTE